VDGRVKDTAGNAIEGVQVVGGGSTTTTGSDGSFHLAADPGMDQIVTFSREGYVTSSRQVDVFSGTTTSLIITLMAEGDPVTVNNAENSLTVPGSRKESLVAPAGAFVDSDGNAVTGDIQVYLTPFDPAVPEQFSAYPGNLRGLTLAGDIVTLETFGVMDVTVRQNGQDLQIADGKTVDIRIPLRPAAINPTLPICGPMMRTEDCGFKMRPVPPTTPEAIRTRPPSVTLPPAMLTGPTYQPAYGAW